ncbi:MAG: glycosyltransferase family 2 protein [Stellaceae bacterium]
MLTVLIATHNGTDTLGRTLERFCALTPPPGGWKLLVVNNASTDGTEELVLRYQERLPLQYLLEPRLGKPYALNVGLDHISGDLVVFADDDVLPDPDWLVAWRRAVDRHPECAIFGGAIEPLYELDPPKWLFRIPQQDVLFSRTDPLPEGPIPATGPIFGPNMAVRTTALANGTRFDERFFVGPVGLMGEETDFVYRLAEWGNQACFVPSARVRHIVHPSQFAWRWVLRRLYRHGKTLFLFEVRRDGRRAPEILHIPRYLLRRAITKAATLPIALLSGSRDRIFSHLRLIAYDLGAIAQSRAMHRDPAWRDAERAGSGSCSTIADPVSH